MGKKERLKRYIIFAVGLYITAFGVALTTKAGLGTSPITAIPYTLSLILPQLTIGNWTIIFNMLLLVGYMVILRDKFRRIELIIGVMMSQTIVMTAFGYFIDFSVFLLGNIALQLYVLKLLLMVSSCAIIAFGVYLQLISDVTLLSGDLFNSAIAQVLHKEYGSVRVASDIIMSSTAAVLCLIFLGALTGVREGTVIASLIVGNIINFYNRRLTRLNYLLLPENKERFVAEARKQTAEQE